MPRKCKTCSSPNSRAINLAIAGGLPITQIASRFGLHYKSVEWHAKNHVQPALRKAAQAEQTTVIVSLRRFRPEINYKPLEKTRWMQNHIANILDQNRWLSLKDQISLIKELRGWCDMENKLCGNYQRGRFADDAEIDKVARAYNSWCNRYPEASEEERLIMLEEFAKGAEVPVEALARRFRDFEDANQDQNSSFATNS